MTDTTPAPEHSEEAQAPAPKKELPVIAIVGRPNVGKSALFNKLSKRRLAIVHDQPGVTRDRLATESRVTQSRALLIDTGGIGANLDDGFAEQVRAETDIAIQTADLILFILDGQEGVHPIDRNLAQDLRKAGCPVQVVVNKIDEDMHEKNTAEFSSLGFADAIHVSAAHGRGFNQLIECIDNLLVDHGLEVPRDAKVADDETELPAGPIKLAIIGKPNVGKSSLINALLNDQRAIVSEVAGTTRDAFDVPFQFNEMDYILIDTAGLRPRSKRDTSVEVFSAMRTESSIRRADICALVVDAGQGVTAQDRKIAKLILDAGKPCFIVLNKFDLYHPGADYRDRMEELSEHVSRELFFLHYAPHVAVSAKEREHLPRIFHTIDKIRGAAKHKVGTGELNRILKKAMTKTPPPLIGKRKRLKLLYATMTKPERPTSIPAPIFVLFINSESLLSDSYKRYLENTLRGQQNYNGLPINFIFRSRAKKADL